MTELTIRRPLVRSSVPILLTLALVVSVLLPDLALAQSSLDVADSDLGSMGGVTTIFATALDFILNYVGYLAGCGAFLFGGWKLMKQDMTSASFALAAAAVLVGINFFVGDLVSVVGS